MYQKTHIYYLTVSSVSADTLASYIATLPEKFKQTEYGSNIAEQNGQDSGSGRVCFYMTTAKNADILRKRFQRRFGGRAKWARLVLNKPKKPAPAPAPTTEAQPATV